MNPSSSADHVAIIGYAVRLPGADDPAALWANCLAGRVASRRHAADELRTAGAPDDPAFVPVASMPARHRSFDHEFFGFTEREAALMDPQRRILFETAWHAFEDAAVLPAGTRTGAWLSTSQSEYFMLNIGSRLDLFEEFGAMLITSLNGQDFAATQLAYKLDLRGPALNVNTACSSSLVGVHQAVSSLLAGECDMAVVGGGSLPLAQEWGYWAREGGINSPTGRCRPFDAAADGTISGGGAAAVVLKRLDDALADGDAIRAVILGSAVNNDGGRKVGFTAPSVEGQAEVIAEALAVAQVEPEEVAYVETHGTGTALGDAIEVASLAEVFGSADRDAPLPLGSLKANIGHCNAAAGVASLIKATLVADHRLLPPLAGLASLNGAIDFAGAGVTAMAEARPLTAGSPCIVGVSSFGIGGTNAHVVVAPAPPRVPTAPAHRPVLLPVSARSPAQVEALVTQLATAAAPISDVGYTLALGRRVHPFRTCPVVPSGGTAAQALTASAVPVLAEHDARETVMLIAGQGEPLTAAWAALYQAEPVFREAVGRCRAILAERGPAIDWDALASGQVDEAAVRETRVHQVALFVFHYAAATLWMHWGVGPGKLVGHSHGQFVAAVLAGAFSLADGLRLVAARGALMNDLPAGAMTAVTCTADRAGVLAATSGAVIAAHNGPEAYVFSGTREQVATVEAACAADEGCRRLQVDHAFHTPAIAHYLGPFADVLAQVAFTPLRRSLACNSSGRLLPPGTVMTAAEWIEHACGPVRFAENVAAAAAGAPARFVEVGTRATLSRLIARGDLAGAPHRVVLADDLDARLGGYMRLAAWWTSGGTVDWTAFHAGEERRRVYLPGYPFARTEHWITPRRQTTRRIESDWLHTPVWRPRLAKPEPGASWVVIADAAALRPDVRTWLSARNDVHWVSGGEPGDGDDRAVGALRVLARRLTEDRWQVDRIVWAPSVGDHAQVARLVARVGAIGTELLRLLGGAAPMLVGVVSRGVDPLAAAAEQALAAALLTVAQETPGARTRLLAMNPEALPESLDALGGQAAFEHVRATGKGLQVLDYQRVAATEHGQDFKAGGRYLFVGGLGKVGRILTTGLAATMPIEAIVVGRTPMTPDPTFTTADVAAGASAPSLPTAPAAPVSRPEERELHARAALVRLAARVVLDHAAAIGIRLSAHAWTVDALAGALWPATSLQGLGGAMVRTLREAGILQESGQSELTLLAAADLPAADVLLASLAAEHPDYVGLGRRVVVAGAAYERIASGDVRGVDVLFPDGSAGFLNETAPGPSAIAAFSRATDELVGMLRERAFRQPGRPLRILEIGGGTGVLTQRLLAGLAGIHVDYCFTDVGGAFLREARSRVRSAGLGSVEVRRFDLTADPAAQGFGAGEFDCIVGFNVLHVAPDLADAVARLAVLLRRDGLLAMIESVEWMAWAELVWGITGEWWAFTDHARRRDGPLLDAAAWLHLFDRAGFAAAGAGGADGDAERLVYAAAPDAALVARGLVLDPGHRARVEHLRALAAAGAKVRYVRADLADRLEAEAFAELMAGDRLDGIVYAATTGGRALGLADDLSPVAIRAEFSAKAGGLAAIHNLVERTGSPWTMVMSSMSGALGGMGHLGYAAANAWQDGFCEGQRDGARWVSVAWDAWAHAEGSIGASVHEHLLSEDEAVRACRAALRSGRTRVLVSRGDLDRRLDRWVRVPVHGAGVPPAAAGGKRDGEIKAIWRGLLGSAAADDPDASFFALGGDSLVVMQLISRVKQRLGVSISLAEFMRDPTLAGLGRATAGETTWSRVVTLRKGEGEPPVFCIHPGGGGIQCYRALAGALHAQVPVYALLSNRSGPADLPLHDTLEAMASDYARAIRSVRPRGRVVLVGYCFGGMIAHAIAATLERLEGEAPTVLLIDSHAPGVDDGFFDERHFIEAQLDGVALEGPVRELLDTVSSLPPERQAAMIVDRIAWPHDSADLRAMAVRIVHEMILTNRAKNEYSPTARTGGPFYLARIDDPGFHADNNAVPDLGWAAMVSGEVSVSWLKGNHGELLDEANVAQVAYHLCRIIGDLRSAA